MSKSLRAFLQLQRHPNLSLQRHWNIVQLGLILLPFSAFLGGVMMLVPSVVIWQQEYKTLIRQPLNWGFLTLALWLLITACFAFNRYNAFLGLFNFLPFFFVFTALSNLIQTPSQLRRIAWILVIPSLPVSLIGFAQLYLHWGGRPSLLWGLIEWTINPSGNPPGRMASVFTYATVLASYHVIVFVLGLGLWIEETQRNPKYFLSAIVLLDAVALILTNSRNAWAIALLSCLAFALYQGWRRIVAGVGAIAGIILGAAFAPPPFQDGFRAVVPAFFWARLNDQMFRDRPIPQMRSTQWSFAWSLTEQRPITGWGLRNFTQLYEAKTQYWLGHPHNLFLMMSSETGLPAALMLYGLVGWVVAQGAIVFRNWQGENRLIFFTFLMAFVACTLFSLFDITLFDARINTMAWVLLASICGIIYQKASLRKNRDTI
ncbi:O-antigen ligase family protein [Phormidesmis sp. 146-35]